MYSIPKKKEEFQGKNFDKIHENHGNEVLKSDSDSFFDDSQVSPSTTIYFPSWYGILLAVLIIIILRVCSNLYQRIYCKTKGYKKLNTRKSKYKKFFGYIHQKNQLVSNNIPDLKKDMSLNIRNHPLKNIFKLSKTRRHI